MFCQKTLNLQLQKIYNKSLIFKNWIPVIKSNLSLSNTFGFEIPTFLKVLYFKTPNLHSLSLEIESSHAISFFLSVFSFTKTEQQGKRAAESLPLYIVSNHTRSNRKTLVSESQSLTLEGA